VPAHRLARGVGIVGGDRAQDLPVLDADLGSPAGPLGIAAGRVIL
jgi:hypothetical protein